MGGGYCCSTETASIFSQVEWDRLDSGSWEQNNTSFFTVLSAVSTQDNEGTHSSTMTGNGPDNATTRPIRTVTKPIYLQDYVS